MDALIENSEGKVGAVCGIQKFKIQYLLLAWC